MSKELITLLSAMALLGVMLGAGRWMAAFFFLNPMLAAAPRYIIRRKVKPTVERRKLPPKPKRPKK
jgi:hypothetical protein